MTKTVTNEYFFDKMSMFKTVTEIEKIIGLLNIAGNILNNPALTDLNTLIGQINSLEDTTATLQSSVSILNIDPVTKTYVDTGDTAVQNNVTTLQGVINNLQTALAILNTDSVTKTYVDTGDTAVQNNVTTLQDILSNLQTTVSVLSADPVTKTYVDSVVGTGSPGGSSFRESVILPVTVNGQTIFNLPKIPTSKESSILSINGLVYVYGVDKDFTIAGSILTWFDASLVLDITDTVVINYSY